MIEYEPQPADDFYNIFVVCDSSRHARGKVAKIVAFYRDENGEWNRHGAARFTQMGRRGDKLRAAGIQPDIVDILGPTVAGALRCKLCGRELPPPSDSTLNKLAAQGVSRISLSDLRRASI